MKITQKQNRNVSAFTLIEMIGVLAVIAILAALLVPKIFEAINSARINNCVVSYNTIKTACMDHYGKFGSINSSNGAALSGTVSNYDTVLLAESLIDKPFQVKVGTNAIVEAITGGGNAGNGYDLDGSGTSETTNATYTIEAVISGVAAQDAFDISTRLDGASLSATNSASIDSKGRVQYASGAITTVYMYITHR